MADWDWLLIILLVASSAANLLALGAFWTSQGLRNIANRFVINMVAANLATCALLLPCVFLNRPSGAEDVRQFEELMLVLDPPNSSEASIAVETESYETWLLPPGLLQWGCDVSASWGSAAVLLVVGDTWCAVTDPLRYHSRVNTPRAWGLIASGWVLAALWGSISCATLLIQNSIFTSTYCVVYAALVVFLPFTLISAMYWRIFCEARDSGLRMRRNGSSPLLQSAFNLLPTEKTDRILCMKPLLNPCPPIVNNQGMRRNNSCRHLATTPESPEEITPNKLRHSQSTPDLRHGILATSEDCTSTVSPLIIGNRGTLPPHSCMTNLRHRLSNASSVFRDREESRAARISVLVVFMFLGTYVPHGALVLLRAGPAQMLPASEDGARLSAAFLLLATLASPVLFAYRNKRVRRGVRVLLGVDAKTNARQRANTCRGSSRTSTGSNYSRYLAPPLQFYGDAMPLPSITRKEKKSILKKICFSSRNLSMKCTEASPC